MTSFIKLKLPLVAAALLAMGCAHMVPLSTSAEGIPAAQGQVKTAGAKNDNTNISIKVEHMAPPGRVANGATTYVVWAQPNGSDAVQNIGALKVDKHLNGTLLTVVPFDTFKVFITAEPTAQITAPTGNELLAANITNGK